MGQEVVLHSDDGDRFKSANEFHQFVLMRYSQPKRRYCAAAENDPTGAEKIVSGDSVIQPAERWLRSSAASPQMQLSLGARLTTRPPATPIRCLLVHRE